MATTQPTLLEQSSSYLRMALYVAALCWATPEATAGHLPPGYNAGIGNSAVPEPSNLVMSPIVLGMFGIVRAYRQTRTAGPYRLVD